MAIAAIGVNAQNIQLHYDFGSSIYSTEEDGRQNVTATFEKFSADNLGSWYYFVDLDIDKDGVMGAYTEVSREFNFAKASETSSFAAHIEFDGGMGRGGSYQSAGLIGAAWNGHNADFSTTYSVQAMYKQFFKQSGGGAHMGEYHRQFASALAQMQAYCTGREIPFLFVFDPSKASVLPDIQHRRILKFLIA